MDHSDLRRRGAAATAANGANNRTGPVLRVVMSSTGAEAGAASPAPPQSAAASAAANQGGVGAATTKPTLPAVPVAAKGWIPDDAIAVCSAPECRIPFTFLKRKHHCRTCGHIFCGNCSGKVVIADDGFTQLRCCLSCYHQHQLVIAPYRGGRPGVPRRRCRGELKLLTSRVLVAVASFLDGASISAFALTSSDFYFIARDNALWELLFHRRFNRAASGAATTAQAQDGTNPAATAAAAGSVNTSTALSPPPPTSPSTTAPATGGANSVSTTGGAAAAAGGGSAAAAAAAVLTSPHNGTTGGLGTVISHNYSVFPVYVRHLVADRFEGLATYASRVRQLFTVGPRIAVVGPPRSGKTQLIRRFLGDSSASSAVTALTTIGIRSYDRRVAIAGSVATTTTVILYEVQGDDRYHELRRLCIANCHAVICCYDATSLTSLDRARAQLAEAAGEVDPAGAAGNTRAAGSVTPPPAGLAASSNNNRSPTRQVPPLAAAAATRPVVACGVILPSPGTAAGNGGQHHSQHSRGGSRASLVPLTAGQHVSPRCALSLQVAPADGAHAVEAAVQAAVEALADRAAAVLPHPTVLDVLYNQA